MLAAGIGIEEAPDVVLDGRPHRFRVAGDKGREKSGWYVFFGDNLPAGRFGNWRGDLSVAWHATPDHVLTPAERELIELSYERARLMHEAEAKKKHEQAAAACSEIWEKAAAADSANGYLVRKQVKSHGLRQTGDGRLIMPIYVGERLTSLQYISADGTKEFHAGGEVSYGYFFIPPTGAAAKAVYVVEGYATGASVHEATGAGVVVALNAGNLSKVGQFLRGKMPQARIAFVADNDKSGVGQQKARAAAETIRAGDRAAGDRRRERLRRRGARPESAAGSGTRSVAGAAERVLPKAAADQMADQRMGAGRGADDGFRRLGDGKDVRGAGPGALDRLPADQRLAGLPRQTRPGGLSGGRGAYRTKGPHCRLDEPQGGKLGRDVDQYLRGGLEHS